MPRGVVDIAGTYPEPPEGRLHTGHMSVEVRPAARPLAMHPEPAEGRLDTGSVTLRVQLPVGFASSINLASHLRAPWRLDSEVVEAAVRRVLKVEGD